MLERVLVEVLRRVITEFSVVVVVLSYHHLVTYFLPEMVQGVSSDS